MADEEPRADEVEAGQVGDEQRERHVDALAFETETCVLVSRTWRC